MQLLFALADTVMIEKFIRAFCWMLLHSLWLGVVLILLAGTVVQLTRDAKPALRYALTAILYCAFLLCCVILFIWELYQEGTRPGEVAVSFDDGLFNTGTYLNNLLSSFVHYCSQHASIIVTCWFIIFVLRCYRIGQAFRYINRVGSSALPVPEADSWQQRVQALSRQLGITAAVRLCESGMVKVPVMIGHFKPVIYMPVGLLIQLPADQVEAVLLHELAHIKRKDYLVNIIQHVADAVFFFNPGLLLTSSLLKQEREHCCDDMALSVTRDKKLFIQALISFREHAAYGARFAMGFPGKKDHLLQRITRIVENRNGAMSKTGKGYFLASLLAGLVLLTWSPGNYKSLQQLETTAEQLFTVTAPVVSGEETSPGFSVSQKDVVTNKKKRSSVVQKNTKRELRRAGETDNKMVQEKDYLAHNSKENYAADVQIPEKHLQEYNGDKKSDRLLALERSRKNAELDRIRAEADRMQAEKDRRQADLDRIQADKDRVSAELDRIQADKDRIQAEKDRASAEQDRKQAELDRNAAEEARQRALKNKIKTSPANHPAT